MSEDILKGNNDGYIAVTREGGGTLWGDHANSGTIVESSPRPTARDVTITKLSERIADAIVRRLAKSDQR